MSEKDKSVYNLYQKILKPFFFKIDPELVHDFVLMFGYFLGKFKITKTLLRNNFLYQNNTLEQKIDNLFFPNPIGLSAGFDKDGYLLETLPEVGFGFGIIGTVTFYSYKGNKKPRLVRFPLEKSILVNYGLKNQGVKKISQRYEKRNNRKFISGLSIGKTNSRKTVTCDQGLEDYYQCFSYAINKTTANFFEINISCPNTFGGEPFTKPEDLKMLLEKLKPVADQRPVYLKMPINISDEDFINLAKLASNYDYIKGLSIGNLQKNTKVILEKYHKEKLKGGLSGMPTQKRSTDLIALTKKEFKDRFTIIGIGGIFSGQDAFEKLQAGANLVAGITGLIYEGPIFAKKINQELAQIFKKENIKNIQNIKKLS